MAPLASKLALTAGVAGAASRARREPQLLLAAWPVTYPARESRETRDSADTAAREYPANGPLSVGAAG